MNIKVGEGTEFYVSITDAPSKTGGGAALFFNVVRNMPDDHLNESLRVEVRRSIGVGRLDTILRESISTTASRNAVFPASQLQREASKSIELEAARGEATGERQSTS